MSLVKFTIVNIGTLSMNKFWNETDRMRHPSSTCTLLQTNGTRILVDPSPAPDLLEPLLFNTTGLRPDAVDAVFLTHIHGDHRLGLELFGGKQCIMSEAGLTEWRERVPQESEIWGRFLPAEEHLPAPIRLLPTPGHTPAHCSLAMDTQWGSLVVAGDAAMTPDFFDAEEGFHNSANPQQAKETIQMIKRTFKVVVPGHGNYIINRK